MPFWLLIQAGSSTSGARMISPPWRAAEQRVDGEGGEREQQDRGPAGTMDVGEKGQVSNSTSRGR